MYDYSVHNEPDFARVYDEDEIIEIRKGDLRALLDIASTSMDFGSGFLNNEDVEILRAAAVRLDIDPLNVTPHNFVCQYSGHHNYRLQTSSWGNPDPTKDFYFCTFCHKSQYVDTGAEVDQTL